MTNLSIRVVDDPCSPDPCQNSGTCTRSGTSFTCNCQLGWGGKTCANECEDPTPTNGTALFPGGLPNGQLAQIDCNTGFNRIGHDLIFCDKGTWSDTTTCEIAECGDPKPTFGSSNHTDTTYLATAWIDCNTGYNRNGPSFIECQDGNSWSGTPTCLPMDCGDPTPSSGSANDTTYTYGAALEIECTTGYNIIGSSVIVCQTDGTWSDSPTCNPSDCLSPTITNGDTPMAPKGTTYGALAILTCLEGYIMNGDAFVTCQEDSTWSTLPSCDLRDCGDPKPSDSSANDTTYTYGTALEIECTAGYDIIGSSVILCQTDGTWSDSPTCNPSDCGTLMIADGHFSAVSGTTLGQHATLTCDIGYNHSGNSTISCTDYGWNGTATCTIKDCLPPTVTNADTPLVPKGTKFGALAILTCLEGYTMNGDAFVTCQENSTWSTLPSCDIKAECPSETTDDPTYGTFVWPSTLTGDVSYIKCPHQQSESSAVKFASRICERYPDNHSGRWIAPIVSQCLPVDETSRELQNIAQTNITNDNVEAVSTSLNNLTSQWQTFESVDVNWSVEAITASLKTNISTTSHTVIGNTFDIVNQLLFIEENVLIQSENKFNSSNRLVTAVETMLDRINVTNGDYKVVKDNIAGFVVGVDGSDFDGLSMSYIGAGNEALTNSPISYVEGETITGDGQSGIVLPSSLLATIPDSQRNDVNRMSLSVFRDLKIFTTIAQTNEFKSLPVDGGDAVPAERKINSNVIAASVPLLDIKDLNDPVVVTLQHFNRGENVSCVYWDSVGLRWSVDGCSVNLTTDHYTVCQCDHLTNFALLMDVYGSVDGADALALQIISYVGCGLSLIGVILTLVTYLKFRKLRRGNPSIILMNLCVAIGLVDLVFLAGEQEYAAVSVVGCKVVAVLLHYFLVSVMCWMAVEAFNIYLALVKVFDTYVARFQLKSALFGWALPIVVVVITLGVNTSDNYGLQSGGICWLGRVPFYAAFLGPVCLLLIINSIIYVLAIRKIVNRSGNMLPKTDKPSTAVRLRGAISLLFLLGLTWAFAFLAVDKFGIVFHYLFAVFNSLQGFFIFIFHCLWRKEARACWSKEIQCLTSPYERSMSTTYSKGGSSTDASSTSATKQSSSFISAKCDDKEQ